jgi:hypothetical protein
VLSYFVVDVDDAFHTLYGYGLLAEYPRRGRSSSGCSVSFASMFFLLLYTLSPHFSTIAMYILIFGSVPFLAPRCFVSLSFLTAGAHS